MADSHRPRQSSSTRSRRPDPASPSSLSPLDDLLLLLALLSSVLHVPTYRPPHPRLYPLLCTLRPTLYNLRCSPVVALLRLSEPASLPRSPSRCTRRAAPVGLESVCACAVAKGETWLPTGEVGEPRRSETTCGLAACSHLAPSPSSRKWVYFWLACRLSQGRSACPPAASRRQPALALALAPRSLRSTGPRWPAPAPLGLEGNVAGTQRAVAQLGADRAGPSGRVQARSPRAGRSRRLTSPAADLARFSLLDLARSLARFEYSAPSRWSSPPSARRALPSPPSQRSRPPSRRRRSAVQQHAPTWAASTLLCVTFLYPGALREPS